MITQNKIKDKHPTDPFFDLLEVTAKEKAITFAKALIDFEDFRDMSSNHGFYTGMDGTIWKHYQR